MNRRRNAWPLFVGVEVNDRVNTRNASERVGEGPGVRVGLAVEEAAA